MNLKDKLKSHRSTSHCLPTAKKSEMYVIGASMLLNGAVQSVFSVLRHWHFYFDQNKIIWKAITRLIKRGNQAITKDLLYLELHKKAYFEGEIDAGYLQQCIDTCGTGIAVVSRSALICHRDQVHETFSRRQLIDLGHTIQFYGFLPGGNTTKMLNVFDKRKERIEKAYQNATGEEVGVLEFNPDDPIEMVDCTLKLNIDGNSFGIAEQGCIVSVSGREGTRKTTLLSAIIASAYKRKSILGFSLERRGGAVLFFDTEQPEKQFKHTQRRIFNMCARQNTKPDYYAYNLRKLSPIERISAIEKKIKQHKHISAIVIDGVLDLVDSMNNEEQSTKVVQRLMLWTEQTGAIVFAVLHDTASSGKMGGHLGSLLARKQDAEINVSLCEDADWSNVAFRKIRGSRRPRSFDFTQDSNGHPVLAAPVQTPAQPALAVGGRVYTIEDDCPF